MGWKGIESPAPPPLRIGCCWRNCETSACCRKCGGVGANKSLEQRGNLMLVAILLSLLGLLFLCLALGAASSNSSTIKALYWSKSSAPVNVTVDGETFSGSGSLYVALRNVLVEGDNSDFERTFAFDSDNCNKIYSSEQCNDCNEATDNALVSFALSIFSRIMQLVTDIQRSTAKGDLNCQKVMALVTGVVGTVTSLQALAYFEGSCVSDLPDVVTVGSQVIQIDNDPGPGFALALIGTLLTVIDVVLHIYLVTPFAKRAPSYADVPPGKLIEEQPQALQEIAGAAV